MTAAIPDEIRALVVADYQTGMTQHAVASKYHVGAATVHRIIKSAGVERGRKFTATMLDEAVQDYLDTGDSIRTVSTRHPLSEDTLRKELSRREITRPSGGTIPEKVRNAAINDFLDGMTIANVSAKHKVARSSVSSWLDAAGLGAEDREGGDSPGVYTGGWVVIGGVRRPLAPMRYRTVS